ncbi:MAG: hypothetical protein E6Q97_25925 [Desulfurellales bacterium]|nr:MAG: hypothetical protein E6Q97_25925 [Desulfurellales bacterium]
MRVSFEGDSATALSFLSAAEQELFGLKQRMGALGLNQGSFHASFSNGEAYAYGYVLPTGLEAVHIVTAPGPDEKGPLEYADPTTPDFLSGYLVSGKLVEVPTQGGKEERVRDFRPGKSCLDLHGEEVSPGANRVRRLAIRPGDIAGLREGEPIAQASVIRPTMYSGTMRMVIQFLLGLGKQFSDESIYDEAEPPLPDEVIEKIEDEAVEGEDETSYESTVKSQGVRIRYDHRFQRTHGLIRAADQKWWVVEISQGRGIMMMRLPLCRHTDLPEFRQKCETLSDHEAIQVLDMFGGFPSGEPFPTEPLAVESAVRSGRIIRAKTSEEISEFYSLSGYSSIMGWAFSDSGSEAHNTGYTYDDQGYAKGSHYAAQMTVGAFIDVEPDELAEVLKGILSEVDRKKKGQVFDEVMWKVDRMSKQDIEQFLEVSDRHTASDLFDMVNEVTLTPSAPVSCSFTRVSEGYLYSRAQYGSQVKFPEPILEGCISAPLYQQNGALPAVSCDTTVHVFFVGEELKWVKYFFRPSKSEVRVMVDNYTGREDIPVGDFYYERHTGNFGIAPGFYSNNFDDRVERGETIYTERYKRRFSGYYEILTPDLGVGDRASDYIDRDFDPPIPWSSLVLQPLTVWRMAKFSYEKWTSLRHGHDSRAAITIPMEDRCSYYYTIEEGNAGGMDSYTFSFEKISDPNVGYYNTPAGFGDNTIQGVSTSYSVGSQIWPNHQERIDFANSGPWAPIGANVGDIVTKTSIDLGAFSKEESTLIQPRFTLRCHFVSASEHGVVEVFNQSKTGSDFYPSRWFMLSPDPDSGFVDVINSTHNALGSADTLVYSPDINATERVLKGKPDDTILRTVIPTFIGPLDA